MTLIRTGLRDKPPLGFSYPVGAEKLSAALFGVPQYDVLWISFNRNPWQDTHNVPKDFQEKNFKAVVTVVFNQRPSTATYNDSWYISIHAVPSEFRSSVSDMLTQVGLPRVKSWLELPRMETWYDRSMRIFTVAVSIEERFLCAVETRNDCIISVDRHTYDVVLPA